MEIRDPKTHSGAEVNAFGQLLTQSVTISEDRHVNLEHNKVWSYSFTDIDPVGANDYFFYFKNNDSINYILTDVRGSTTVAGRLSVRHVTGTAAYVGESAVAPINRYLGSTSTPTATCNTDTDITGLTSSGDVFIMDIATTGQLNHLRTTAGIIIPPGQSFALNWSAATGILTGTISIAALI